MLNITSPTLLLDEKKCKANIQSMIDKSQRLGVKLVPHFKTHQSIQVGHWFSELGIKAITVSSLKMAEFFASNGWKDITVAFPVNTLEIERINRILNHKVDLKLLVVSSEVIHLLDTGIRDNVKILIELDAGYNRTGVSTEDTEGIKEIVQAINISEKSELYGIYCHPGNTYQTESTSEIKSIWAAAIEKMVNVKSSLIQTHPDLKIRMGDTPGCVVVEDMAGIDEIGPGNFVFYDLVMNYLDVCKEDQIAVAMACPVVAKNGERNQIVIHGGAVHFSKDHLFDNQEKKFFGEVVILEEDGWSPIVEGIKLTSLSQEHGTLTVDPEIYDTIEVGDVLGILPIHSCLTANLMKSYTCLDGKVIGHMEKIF